ncbi:MAG: YifB family Mg chelatase-like AAA ATPase [Gammaproteobacteria bacterium]|nr:YifB family Mg chelatase-like AAA ATPase [Gammaproteobacteria bacterium]
MSLAICYSRALTGIYAQAVTVEVHLSPGLPALSIVGLPEAAVKESKDRVRAALLNSNFEFPTRRITINLAPADLPKEGGRFDLPIALGILAASGQIPQQALHELEFVGELALGGELRAIRGVLPSSMAAGEAKRGLVVPKQNATEAALSQRCQVFSAGHLLEVCAHLTGRHALSPFINQTLPVVSGGTADLLDVFGQYKAKRALEICAAGGHNLLLVGPAGTGKSMLATRLVGLLPPLQEQEAMEVAMINSISSEGFDVKQWKQRPYRAPHHTASGVALVGGGANPKPGEISLAHHGILFLDELPEFDRAVLDVLREPLESGSVSISRANQKAEYPARFQLVAAMNPCLCGNLGDPKVSCRCSPAQRQRYLSRLSGPFLDRIDVQIDVPRMARDMLSKIDPNAESSAVVRERVQRCRTHQLQRSKTINAQLENRELLRVTELDAATSKLLDVAMERLNLSARAYHRILKVARTIADLAESETLKMEHVTEALSYRALERLVQV